MSLRVFHWSLFAICAGMLLWESGQAAEVPGQGPLVGTKAPGFDVQGIYSEDYSLESFKGHILVMQFGASW